MPPDTPWLRVPPPAYVIVAFAADAPPNANTPARPTVASAVLNLFSIFPPITRIYFFRTDWKLPVPSRWRKSESKEFPMVTRPMPMYLHLRTLSCFSRPCPEHRSFVTALIRWVQQLLKDSTDSLKLTFRSRQESKVGDPIRTKRRI